jgi:hypothetical protein
MINGTGKTTTIRMLQRNSKYQIKSIWKSRFSLVKSKLQKAFDDHFNNFLDYNEDDEDGDFEEQVEKIVVIWNNQIEELGCKRTVRLTKSNNCNNCASNPEFIWTEMGWVNASGTTAIPHPHDNEFIIVPEELALKICTLGFLPSI